MDERPDNWDGSTKGDFEIDTILGKEEKVDIVTLVERNTKVTLARKLPEGKKAKALAEMVILMLMPYVEKIWSITTDKGCEFSEHLLVAKRLQTGICFTHPYSSWKKGCIEYQQQTHKTLHTKRNGF